LVARRKDRLETTARALETEFGIRAIALPDDLAKPDAPARLFAELSRRQIDIDVLVNSAGAGIARTFCEVDGSDHAELIQVQLTAVAQLTRLWLPSMIERGYGRVINVASLAGLLPGRRRARSIQRRRCSWFASPNRSPRNSWVQVSTCVRSVPASPAPSFTT
jgi:hypothetical protein